MPPSLSHVHQRHGFRIGASVCIMAWLSLAASAAQYPSGIGNRWWRDRSIQRHLALTAAQVNQLETIFERDLPARIALHQKVRGMDAELLRVLHDEDEARVLQFIDDLEVLRRKQNTRRALMLLEMYKLLTPTQRTKLTAMSAARANPR
jgi:Spy/CpxP family protein refolding chaperone